MKTKTIRMYGAKDLRFDKFELGELRSDEILASVVSDSICMSTYKAVQLGENHKRVPEGLQENPVVIGHEFTGKIIAVGEKWTGKYKPGDKYAIQPNINSQGKGYAPGYSFTDFGGNATFIRIPAEVMEKEALLPYSGNAYYKASLAEPLSCIIAAFKASFHYAEQAGIVNQGILPGGSLAILAGAGPMGLGAVDYAINGPVKPARVVVTDIDDERLARAKRILPPEMANESGVELIYLNTGGANPEDVIKAANGGSGYDDVFIFAPIAQVIETGDKIAGPGCCINFFAGPTNEKLSAMINFYNVHYAGTHIVGTSGGSNLDMIEAIDLISRDAVNPSVMLTHIGGIDSVIESVLNLPSIPGGKKLIYNHINMPLTAIDDMANMPEYKDLYKIVESNNGLWSAEAEKMLLGMFGVEQDL